MKDAELHHDIDGMEKLGCYSRELLMSTALYNGDKLTFSLWCTTPPRDELVHQGVSRNDNVMHLISL